MTNENQVARPDGAALGGAADFDFGHLEIEGRTFWYELPAGVGAHGCALELRIANEQNRPYRDGLLALSGRRLMGRSQGRRDDDEQLDIEDDLRLFPQHVVVGWRAVTNKGGLEVAFSPLACERFLRALPRWIFSRVRVMAKLPENFVDQDRLPPPQTAELVGN